MGALDENGAFYSIHVGYGACAYAFVLACLCGRVYVCLGVRVHMRGPAYMCFLAGVKGEGGEINISFTAQAKLALMVFYVRNRKQWWIRTAPRSTPASRTCQTACFPRGESCWHSTDALSLYASCKCTISFF